MTARPYRLHEESTIESLAEDPEFAAVYLNAVLADGDESERLLALGRLVKAFAGTTDAVE